MTYANDGIVIFSSNFSRDFTMHYMRILFSVEFQKSPMSLSMKTDEARTMATR